MGERPRPTLLQLVKVNFFPLGLEFISGSSMTFVVPSLMSSGKWVKCHNYEFQIFFLELRSDVVAIVLGSGSLLAMIMGPKIGAWSDIHENSKNGKRTPFILGISVVVLISLLLIPYR
jgi:MFS family permease